MWVGGDGMDIHHIYMCVYVVHIYTHRCRGTRCSRGPRRGRRPKVIEQCAVCEPSVSDPGCATDRHAHMLKIDAPTLAEIDPIQGQERIILVFWCLLLMIMALLVPRIDHRA